MRKHLSISPGLPLILMVRVCPPRCPRALEGRAIRLYVQPGRSASVCLRWLPSGRFVRGHRKSDGPDLLALRLLLPPDRPYRFYPSHNRKKTKAGKNIPMSNPFRHALGNKSSHFIHKIRVDLNPGRYSTSVITTKFVTDQVLIFLPISSLLFSRVAGALLLHRALI